jgi:hypothetical protein
MAVLPGGEASGHAFRRGEAGSANRDSVNPTANWSATNGRNSSGLATSLPPAFEPIQSLTTDR